MDKIGKRHLRRQVSFLVERQVRKMAERLETMEYRFNVISSYCGNDFILNNVQRWLNKAIDDVTNDDVTNGTATDIWSTAYPPVKTFHEPRTKVTGWKVKRREYWLEDKYQYWSDEALAEAGLTRAERPLEKASLEKMEYRFEVVSSWSGNDYILDTVQRRLGYAINEVKNGNATAIGNPITGANEQIEVKETHVEKWNVERYFPDEDE